MSWQILMEIFRLFPRAKKSSFLVVQLFEKKISSFAWFWLFFAETPFFVENVDSVSVSVFSFVLGLMEHSFFISFSRFNFLFSPQQ